MLTHSLAMLKKQTAKKGIYYLLLTGGPGIILYLVLITKRLIQCYSMDRYQ